MCNAVAPFLSLILTSIPLLFISISTILSCPLEDAKKDLFLDFFYYFNFILYKPLCNAVHPYLSVKLIILKSEMN